MISISATQLLSLPEPATLSARPMGIDTYQEPVLYMRADCPICRSEGFESQSRVGINGNGRTLIATLNIVHSELLDHGEAGLSDVAWSMLETSPPCSITLSHPEPIESFRYIRAKLFGHVLTYEQLHEIVKDIAARRYSDVQLSAFLTACVGERMNGDEIVALTQSMVDVGERLSWPQPAVFDKHCVGGLPGNRTTPIIVAIAAACGLVMPKTSSRAITSPAGTADTMETLTTVNVSLDTMRKVVDQEGGCLVWGGSANLSPADDILIRIERALDVDSEAQLVASVLSKKIAAGSTHTVIDIPVGPTAKVRDKTSADRLAHLLEHTGKQLGLAVTVVITDGTQPVGNGIGPALEARDVLKILKGEDDAPADLTDRATSLAGLLLELSGRAHAGAGKAMALAVIDDGRAWKKFQRICEAQGGLRTPPIAEHQQLIVAAKNGRVQTIDNRRLAKVAKLAGAPTAPSAGVDLHVHIGDVIKSGEAVMTVHAEAPGELTYALDYLRQHPALIHIDTDAGED